MSEHRTPSVVSERNSVFTDKLDHRAFASVPYHDAHALARQCAPPAGPLLRSSPRARAARLRRKLSGPRGLRTSLAHGREELPSLLQQPLAFLTRGHHFSHRLENIARAKVKAAVEALDRTVDIIVVQARVLDRA